MPADEKIETTYVVPAVIGTGDASAISCQPDADSPENVALASSLPLVSQRWPTCVPVSPGLL